MMPSSLNETTKIPPNSLLLLSFKFHFSHVQEAYSSPFGSVHA